VIWQKHAQYKIAQTLDSRNNSINKLYSERLNEDKRQPYLYINKKLKAGNYLQPLEYYPGKKLLFYRLPFNNKPPIYIRPIAVDSSWYYSLTNATPDNLVVDLSNNTGINPGFDTLLFYLRPPFNDLSLETNAFTFPGSSDDS